MDVNKYFLFASLEHYPCGGWKDFIGKYPTLQEAVAEGNRLFKADKIHFDWFHVVDISTMKIVWELEQ